MKTPHVTVSSKYQIVLPEEIRSALNIKPGQKIAVMQHASSITLVPVRPLNEMLGSLPSHPWQPRDLREKADRDL
ncbi:MAG: AbrB/MazE/SpoVT family DNA-binding domain-containing protein [Burkholderiales bacterium]|nr:AbrB/MazE/SpoVT family DNA-binding domain-containing protein [Phycisphaerae bacterium]